MKKKSIVLAATALMMAAALVIGGTLAYFTDTDNATNTFTAGGVKIDLNEQQRGENGLEDFEQDKILMPIVGSAQGEKDEYGMPKADNYVDKMVTVTNTGASDAYVRAYFAIPSALDDGYETFNAGLNVLHFNFGNKVTEDGTISSTYGVEWIWKHDGKWNYFETTIDDVSYNVYYADDYEALPAGETTERFVDGVYLDKSFDQKDDGTYVAFGQDLDLGSLDMNEVSCPVFAVAVQAAGFDSADEAITEAFGANYNPFGGTSTNWQ